MTEGMIVSARTGLPFPARKTHDPRAATCPLHLRRVCGVCTHFKGKVIRCEAPCTFHPSPRSGGTQAGDCPFWERRTEGQG